MSITVRYRTASGTWETRKLMVRNAAGTAWDWMSPAPPEIGYPASYGQTEPGYPATYGE